MELHDSNAIPLAQELPLFIVIPAQAGIQKPIA
jgi:hypothetical protein